MASAKDVEVQASPGSPLQDVAMSEAQASVHGDTDNDDVEMADEDLPDFDLLDDSDLHRSCDQRHKLLHHRAPLFLILQSPKVMANRILLHRVLLLKAKAKLIHQMFSAAHKLLKQHGLPNLKVGD